MLILKMDWIGLDGEWIAKRKAFIENYDHVLTILKNYYNLKNSYTITSMSLVGQNRSFL